MITGMEKQTELIMKYRIVKTYSLHLRYFYDNIDTCAEYDDSPRSGSVTVLSGSYKYTIELR